MQIVGGVSLTTAATFIGPFGNLTLGAAGHGLHHHRPANRDVHVLELLEKATR